MDNWIIYGRAILITTVIYLGLAVAKKFLCARLGQMASRLVYREFLQGLLEAIRKTSQIFLFIVALGFGLQSLTLPQTFEKYFDRFEVVVFFVQAVRWANAFIHHYFAHAFKEKFGTDQSAMTSINVLALAARILIFAALTLLFLEALGVNVTTLVAGLGVGGIAVALAVQNILGDLFASLTIILDKPFIVGDLLTIGEFTGRVEQVGLKNTRLKSVSGEQLIFANSDLLQSRLRNFKRSLERRLLFTIGVAYETPVEKLKKIPSDLKKIIESHPGTRAERIWFKGFGASALDFEVNYFYLERENRDAHDVPNEIHFKVLEYFVNQKIEIAYPTQTIHLAKGLNG